MDTARNADLRMRDVNPSHPDLTPAQAALLRDLLRQREDYSCRGRWQEARGVGIALLIVWKNLVRPDAELPTTWMGDL